jgi:hypothetical protein
MQELQCVDSIVSFLEREKETNVRDAVFSILFDDLSSTKFILQLLVSYAMSTEAPRTLECVSKLITGNIGNDSIVHFIFDKLIKDHFLLAYEPNTDTPQDNIIKIAHVSPYFASLFMAILLDMLTRDLIIMPSKCLKKMFNLFEIWIEKNSMLPMYALTLNLQHSNSAVFNPMPGLMYTTIIYPFKNFIECLKSFTKNVQTKVDKVKEQERMQMSESNQEDEDESASYSLIMEHEFKRFVQEILNLDDLVSKVHFLSLKLLKDLSTFLNNQVMATAISRDSFKLISLKNIDAISRCIEQFNKLIDEQRTIQSKLILNINSNHKFNSENIKITFDKIQDGCLERLAQLLGLCFEFGFVECEKTALRDIFSGYFHNRSDQSNPSLLEIILND